MNMVSGDGLMRIIPKPAMHRAWNITEMGTTDEGDEGNELVSSHSRLNAPLNLRRLAHPLHPFHLWFHRPDIMGSIHPSKRTARRGMRRAVECVKQSGPVT